MNISEKMHKRKKHMRRTAAEIERDFIVKLLKKFSLNFYSVHTLIVESIMDLREV